MTNQSEFTVEYFDAMARSGWLSLTCKALTRYFRCRRLPSVDGGRCIIMANGPSLAAELENNIEILQRERVLAVNMFAQGEHFETVKPEFYCLADPALLDAINRGWARQIRVDLFNALVEKTSWKMDLFFPFYPGQILIDEVLSSTPISMHMFHYFPAYKWIVLRNYVYRMGVLLPPVQNVLVAAIFMCINMGFKEIYIIGADHSWPHDIAVDKNNVVHLRPRHFDGGGEPSPWIVQQTGARRSVLMHEWTAILSRTFHAYHLLSEYAAFRGVSVYNATEGSLIDAFPRVTLADMPMIT